MNIIHVTRRFVASEWGGTETVVLETSRAMQSMGNSSTIFTSTALASRGVEMLFQVPVERYPYFYPYLGLSREARRRLDHKGGNLFSFSLWGALAFRSHVDILHLHTGKRLGGIVRTVARMRRIPYVVSIHGGVLDVPAAEAATLTEPTRRTFEWGRMLGWLVGSRRVFDDADMLICVGAEEQRRLQQAYPNKRIEYLPNGVDFERFATGDGTRFRRAYGIAPERRVLLTVGRIDPQKNQLFLVDQLPALLRKEPRAHLLLVGASTNDAYADRLRRRVAEPDVRNHVTWVEGLPAGSPELADAYHAADLFVLPSVHEPFGIVILEAWASRLAVVASRVGGVPGFVEDGRTGILFEPADGAELTDRLAGVLNDRAFARSLADAGQEKARSQHSWPEVARRLTGFYEEVIRAHSLR